MWPTLVCYRSWLSFCSVRPVSTFCIFLPLPPLLKLDVTNSWICTFPHQNQHAPHHRLVQIWSEHTQNPPAARWWIVVLGPDAYASDQHSPANDSKLLLRQISGLGFHWLRMDWTFLHDPKGSRKADALNRLEYAHIFYDFSTCLSK